MFANARVIWRRVSFDRSIMETVNDGLMSRDMSRWKIGQGKQTNSVRLEILSVDQTYEGYYSCECQYTGSVEPARAERILKVVAVPTINNFQSSYDTTVNEGDRVTLRCEAHGIPPPVISWRRTGGSSSLIRNYGNMKPGELIQFDGALPEDAGTYMCTAQNNLGNAYWPVRLYVRHAPHLRIFTVLPAPRFSCNVQLLCEITANPAPLSTQVQWTNQTGQQIQNAPGRRIVYLDAGLNTFLALSLEPITAADLGKKFSCYAQNTFGSATKEFLLTESSILPGWSINRPQCGAPLQRLCEWLVVILMAHGFAWLN
ncbi:hypothetical protein AAHC03_024434 [Spirometra sp. Aus1]